MRTVQPKRTSFWVLNIYKGWFHEPSSYVDDLERNPSLPFTILSLPSPLQSIYEDFGAFKKKMFLVLRSNKQVPIPP